MYDGGASGQKIAADLRDWVNLQLHENGSDSAITVPARAMAPKVVPTVGLEHLHASVVSVREQAALIVERLRQWRSCSFRSLVADADSTVVIVARFLALLELFHESVVTFEQAEALGELTVRWTGQDDGEIGVSDEFDEDDVIEDDVIEEEMVNPVE